jgi:hypothetical protein
MKIITKPHTKKDPVLVMDIEKSIPLLNQSNTGD